MENVLDMFRLDGKVALVTGCAGSYGRTYSYGHQAVVGLLQAGADVWIASRTLKKNEEYAAMLKEQGFDKEEWMKGFTQLCLVVEDPEALVEKMDPGDMKSFRRVFTKSGEFGVSILVSAPRKIFTSAEPDILTDAVLSAAQVLALDGRPSDYVRGYSLSDPEAATLLDENEIVWIRQDDMRVIRV